MYTIHKIYLLIPSLYMLRSYKQYSHVRKIIYLYCPDSLDCMKFHCVHPRQCQLQWFFCFIICLFICHIDFNNIIETLNYNTRLYCINCTNSHVRYDCSYVRCRISQITKYNCNILNIKGIMSCT